MLAYIPAPWILWDIILSIKYRLPPKCLIQCSEWKKQKMRYSSKLNVRLLSTWNWWYILDRYQQTCCEKTKHANDHANDEATCLKIEIPKIHQSINHHFPYEIAVWNGYTGVLKAFSVTHEETQYTINIWYTQDGAPKIAKLVYKWLNNGLW